MQQKLNKSLAMSLASTLGRLCFAANEQVGGMLQNILKQWCLSLRMLTAGAEREQAYR